MSSPFFLIYKAFISPALSALFFPYGQCRYWPSCSEYAKGSVEKYGIFKGAALGALRLFRCHPWVKGGVDLVP